MNTDTIKISPETKRKLEELGIPISTAYDRLKRGRDIFVPAKKSYYACGRTLTLRQWANTIGMEPKMLYDRIRYRVKQGATESKALENVVKIASAIE